jgi:hypothetical protein
MLRSIGLFVISASLRDMDHEKTEYKNHSIQVEFAEGIR